MSALSELLAAGCKSLEVDLGSPVFTYAGVNYLCIPNTLSKGTVLVLGGKEYIIAFTLNARQSLFSTVKPQQGHQLTYLTKAYRIVSVESDGSGVNYSIHVEDPDK